METHFYKNWELVKKALTEKYGFEYTGIGDNAEECFYKKNRNIEEYVYIHNQHCGYKKVLVMDTSRYNVLQNASIPEYPRVTTTEGGRVMAFNKLCKLLDKATIFSENSGNTTQDRGSRSNLYDWAIGPTNNPEEKLGKDLFAIQRFKDGRIYFSKTDLKSVMKRNGIKIKWL